jgi:hypothetical protein
VIRYIGAVHTPGNGIVVTKPEALVRALQQTLAQKLTIIRTVGVSSAA